MPSTPSRLVRIAAVGAAGAALAGTAVAVAGPATAAAPALVVAYDASGSTLVAKPNSTVKLGPTTLTNYLNPDGTFVADLPLPPTSAAFNIIGLLPAKATVSFIQVGQATGRLQSDPTPRVTATATYIIKLTNVTVAGVPTAVGNSCQTAQPVSIPVATPAGQRFNVTTGGTLTGTYTIGAFANCGLTTSLINQLVPGPNNTVTFTLSNGRIVS